MNAQLLIQALLILFGGLGIFLLGMKFMSDGLQTIAGPSLKKLIGAVTNNRILGVIAGLGVTVLVQSSSITTVMVIGFVNSGIMLLKQAIGVIMGANIGTTITGWILVLNIGKYGLQLAGGAAFVYVFSKREKVRYVALALLGVGLVFMGLEVMKDGLAPIRKVPEFTAWFHAFHADNYVDMMKCVLVGCVLTVMVQSSSATLAITIALATQGLINFETAAALVLGENIGTTITAFLASLGTSTPAARRAAAFHIFFNVVGVIWITSIFPWYLIFIRWVGANFMGVPDFDAMTVLNGQELYPAVTAGIATVHTIFNVVNVLLFLPFVAKIAAILEKFFQGKGKSRTTATSLEYPLMESPFAAVEQSGHELRLMGREINGMMDQLKAVLQGDPQSNLYTKQIFASENRLDIVQEEVTGFLTELLSNRVSHSLAEDAEIQLRIVDDLETVSDYVAQILKLHLRLVNNQVPFTNKQLESLVELHDLTSVMMREITPYLAEPSLSGLEKLRVRGQQVTECVRRLRNSHWESLAQTQFSPLISTSFTDVLVSYRKIKEHVVAVAEAAAGIK